MLLYDDLPDLPPWIEGLVLRFTLFHQGTRTFHNANTW